MATIMTMKHCQLQHSIINPQEKMIKILAASTIKDDSPHTFVAAELHLGIVDTTKGQDNKAGRAHDMTNHRC